MRPLKLQTEEFHRNACAFKSVVKPELSNASPTLERQIPGDHDCSVPLPCYVPVVSLRSVPRVDDRFMAQLTQAYFRLGQNIATLPPSPSPPLHLLVIRMPIGPLRPPSPSMVY
ncbi:hypothetical protein CBL_06449 [Carabus blaptoides fortunei]